jgi:hypothetical protein
MLRELISRSPNSETVSNLLGLQRVTYLAQDHEITRAADTRYRSTGPFVRGQLLSPIQDLDVA